MARTLAVTAIVVLSIGILSARQESGLRRAARERDVTVQINTGYEPATLDMLVMGSGTIVVGDVTFGRTALLGERIVTHYDVTVEQVIRRKGPPGLARGDVLVVRRLGGAMTLEGHNVVGEETDFPQFTIGDGYVLFLQRADQGPYYWVSYGPQGAFHITDNSIRQVSQVFGSWNREHRSAVSLNSFVDQVLALASPR